MRMVLNFLSIISFSPFITDVTETKIEENMKQLKKTKWFQDYLHHEKYRELIIHDNEVRETIGRFHSNKMDRDSYLRKCKKRLQKVLQKKLECS